MYIRYVKDKPVISDEFLLGLLPLDPVSRVKDNRAEGNVKLVSILPRRSLSYAKIIEPLAI